MKQKKIAFLIYNLAALGGAERVITTLANSFTNDYQVTVITIVNAEVTYSLNKEIKILHCREKEIIKSNIFSALKNNLNLYKQIKRKLKKEQIDLLISFMTTSNVLGCLASKALGIPCIISERTNPYIDKPNFVWKKLKKYTYPKADYLIVQSQLIKEYYTSDVNPEKIMMLPNPLSSQLTNSKDLFLKRKNIVLNVGRLVRSKNQEMLIRAFAHINNKDWNLVFVGDGPLLAEYKALVLELNQEKNISFVGRTDDVSTYYNTSKIFAFTSKYEGFPNVLIEAMYFELACISTNCPSGPSELINHNENGFLIDICDQDDLEKQLTHLMNNDALCTSIGKKGFETATNYEAIKVIFKWKFLIEKLLNV